MTDALGAAATLRVPVLARRFELRLQGVIGTGSPLVSSNGVAVARQR